MKLNKKGFTLVELLAVIVVLAIIALIGYSAVGEIIENSRKNTAATTAAGVESAAKQYCMGAMAEDASSVPTTFTMDDLSFDTNGSTVTITGGTIATGCGDIEFTKLEINGYTCTKTNNKWSCGE